MSDFKVLESLLDLGDPVSFQEFCESPKFCNDSYIYKFWLDEYGKFPLTVNEVIVGGALGSGKTFVASYYFAYRVYCLFRNGDPCKRYGLKPDSPIYCIYFSTNKTSAKLGGFKYLRAVFENCQWFKNNMQVDSTIESRIRFLGKNFEVLSGSSDAHAIGLNIWGSILDEANFKEGVGQGNVEEYEDVTRMYTQINDRLASRFSTPNGVEGLSMLISSASYQSAFTESRKAIVQDSPNARIITAVTYRVKPEQFSKETFEVFIGCGAVEPQIIKSPEHKKRLLADAKLLGTGNEKMFIEKVPVSLAPQFENNIDLALQNHCGIPTQVKGRFLSNLRILYKNYSDILESPFVSDNLTASTEDDTQLIEYLVPERLVNPDAPHSLFLDLSVQGDTGSLVATRYDGFINGQKHHTRVFSLHIIPPPAPAQTKISKVKQLIFDLAELLNIVAFGSDNFQSIALRQEVQAELGLHDIRLSLDSSDIPYTMWLQALNEDRLTLYKEELLEKECKECVHDYKRHRVIKSSKSSDDCLQGNVGSFYLSETIASTDVDISDLAPTNRINLVGDRSISNLAKKCGYIS